MESQRLFLAIDVPEREKARITEMQDAMKPLPGARWVPPENLHVTLVFLGRIPRSQMDELGAAFRDAARSVPAGKIALEGTGGFPRAARAGVLWAGLSEPQNTLTDLATLLRRAASGFGVPLDDKPFHAHLTLARLKPSADIRDLPPVPPGAPWRVSEVHLFSSRPGDGAPTYEVKESYPLASSV